MALNTQHSQEVFHAAESVINVAKRDTNILTTALISGTSGTVNFTEQPDVTASAVATYDGCGRIAAGNDVNQHAFRNFTITGTASLGSSSAQANHIQGVELQTPSGGLDC